MALSEWTLFSEAKIYPERRIGLPLEPGDVECYEGKDIHVCCTCDTLLLIPVVETGFVWCPDCKREFHVYHMVEVRVPDSVVGKECVVVCDLRDLVFGHKTLRKGQRRIAERKLAGLIDKVHPLLISWVIFMKENGKVTYLECYGSDTISTIVKGTARATIRKTRKGIEMGCTCWARTKTEAIEVANNIRETILTKGNWHVGYIWKGEAPILC